MAYFTKFTNKVQEIVPSLSPYSHGAVAHKGYRLSCFHHLSIRSRGASCAVRSLGISASAIEKYLIL
jgi:hypothetical protein